MARYAKSGDLHIAYIVEGDGPIDLMWIPPWISQVEYLWSERSLMRVMRRIKSFARFITFDRRGSGLSDPFFGAPTLEDQMDDLIAVMDAVGSERVAIVGTLEGGPMAATFAATHPDRVSALVLYATFARATWAPGYEFAWPADVRDAHMAELVEHWGEGRVVAGVAPSEASDPGFMEWGGRLERLAASPSTIRRLMGLIGEFDVRDVLPSIRVPTLVMHRRDDAFIKIEHSRYLAQQIPGARYVELEGSDNMFSLGDSEGLLGEIEEHLTGVRHVHEPDRMLATVLFTDICDSTRQAAEMGDSGWRSLLERHDALFRHALDRHRGREVKRTGDGFLATFDGPARAHPLCRLRGGGDGVARHPGPRRPPHGRARGDGRRPRRARGAHRGARAGPRLAERGAGLRDGEGPGRGVWNRVRGPGRARAPRRAGRMAPVRGFVRPSATLARRRR